MNYLLLSKFGVMVLANRREKFRESNMGSYFCGTLAVSMSGLDLGMLNSRRVRKVVSSSSV